jgi:hypothetical protein
MLGSRDREGNIKCKIINVEEDFRNESDIFL